MSALKGIRVLELAHFVPGHYCTMMLGDMGADVIKIEAPPASGSRGSSGAGSPQGPRAKEQAAFHALNRNKQSIGINLRNPKGKDIFLQLSKKADVIVEGFRPGVLLRLGIDYETIREFNPGIIYCSLSGYGQDGPYSNLPGHDINYLSMAGVLGLIGNAGEAPAVPLNLIGDFAGASLHGVIGILAALMAREKTGKGQYIDISYMDCSIALMTWFAQIFFSEGTVMKRGESVLQGALPHYRAYKTRDNKYISIGCLEKWFWDNLCRIIGKDEYAEYDVKPEYYFQGAGEARLPEITGALQQVFLTKTRDEWFDILSKENVPVGKVYDLNEVFDDPQVQHRKMVIEIDHPELGKVKQVGMPVKLSGISTPVRSLAPSLGENTVQILKDLGCKSAVISTLLKEGVVF